MGSSESNLVRVHPASCGVESYPRHTQGNAIDFIDYVVEKCPFRIHTIRNDRGHEFQAKLHWQVEDQGMRHV